MRVYVNNIKRFKKAKLPVLSVGNAVAGVWKNVPRNVPQDDKMSLGMSFKAEAMSDKVVFRGRGYTNCSAKKINLSPSV